MKTKEQKIKEVKELLPLARKEVHLLKNIWHKDSYDKGYAQAQKDFEKMIKEWDVEPCCHGIRQDELLMRLKKGDKT
jgi:hypothetical protein